MLGIDGTLANIKATESLYTSPTLFQAPILTLYVAPIVAPTGITISKEVVNGSDIEYIYVNGPLFPSSRYILKPIIKQPPSLTGSYQLIEIMVVVISVMVGTFS